LVLPSYVDFANVDLLESAETNLLFGARVITNVTIDGNFVQTVAGRSFFDIAYGPYGSDTISVTGTTTVAGVADVRLTWLEDIENVLLISSLGEATNNGLEIQDTIAIDYAALATDRGIELAITPQFAQPFLNVNGRALGGHIDSALSVSGSSGIGQLLALLGNLPLGEEVQFASIINELNPEGLLQGLVQQIESSRSFAHRLAGCSSASSEEQRSCIWGGIELSQFDRDGTFDNFSSEAEVVRISAGFEKQFSENFSISAGIGIDEFNSIETDGSRTRSDGDAVNFGVEGKYRLAGGLSASLALSAGWQSLDNVRTLDVFGPLNAVSAVNSNYVRAGARVGYLLDLDNLYVEPAVTGSITRITQDAFAEIGANGFGVGFDDHSQTVISGGAELKAGLYFLKADEGTGLIHVTGGYETFDEDALVGTGRLLGANLAADPARIVTPLNDNRWYLESGISLVGNGTAGLQLIYRGEFGDIDTVQSGSIEFSLQF